MKYFLPIVFSLTYFFSGIAQAEPLNFQAFRGTYVLDAPLSCPPLKTERIEILPNKNHPEYLDWHEYFTLPPSGNGHSYAGIVPWLTSPYIEGSFSSPSNGCWAVGGPDQWTVVTTANSIVSVTDSWNDCDPDNGWGEEVHEYLGRKTRRIEVSPAGLLTVGEGTETFEDTHTYSCFYRRVD